VAVSKEQLTVLDARTGDTLRVIDTEELTSPQWLRMTSARTVIAVGHHFMACHDPETSLRKWRVDAIECPRFDLIREGLGHIYLPIGHNRLAAIAHKDGKIAWEVSLPLEFNEPLQKSWLDGNELYVMSSEQVFKYDTDTGQETWSSPLPSGHRIGTSELTTDDIVVVSELLAEESQREVTVSFIDRDTGRVRHRDRLADADSLPILHQMIVYDEVILLRSGPNVSGWSSH
jgi:hypothetical protein